jgi:hypothetical protein
LGFAKFVIKGSSETCGAITFYRSLSLSLYIYIYTYAHTYTQCTVYPLNCKRTADRPRKTKIVLFDSFSHCDPRSRISSEAEGLADAVYARITASFFFFFFFTKERFSPADTHIDIYLRSIIVYVRPCIYIYSRKNYRCEISLPYNGWDLQQPIIYNTN